MSIINTIKGKIKKQEVKNRKKDETLQFEREYTGNNSVIEGFNILYSNNYTNDFIEDEFDIYSFLSIKITLDKSIKTLTDVIKFMEVYYTYILFMMQFRYKDNMEIFIKENKILIYLKGNINFYKLICDSLTNNIIKRFIQTNLFPEGIYINTPNKFLDKIINSINNPYKDIDILFIEDEFDDEYKNIDNQVIGLSISTDCKEINLSNKNYTEINNRYIIYCNKSSLYSDELKYIIDNVENSDKLLPTQQNSINDIDEIL